MNLTVSRPIKIFALVAVIAAAGGLAMLMMKPKQAAAPPVVLTHSPAAPATTTPASTTAKAAAPAATKPVATKAIGTSKKASLAPATAAATPAVKAPAVGKNGLPTSIDAAFAKHKVVVVSVFDPQSSTDAISYSEAKAGASDAGVGFVGVSLLDSPLAAALTSSLPGGGLLPAPGLLIYRKPGVLVQRIDGFADRDVVAQAAAAGATAQPVSGSGS